MTLDEIEMVMVSLRQFISRCCETFLGGSFFGAAEVIGYDKVRDHFIHSATSHAVALGVISRNKVNRR